MSTLEIVSAWYGTQKDVQGYDATDIIKDRVAAGAEDFFVCNEELKGDPQWCFVKTLWITYSIDGGETTKTFTAEERTSFLFSQLN
jgi:hypothetical protein